VLLVVTGAPRAEDGAAPVIEAKAILAAAGPLTVPGGTAGASVRRPAAGSTALRPARRQGTFSLSITPYTKNAGQTNDWITPQTPSQNPFAVLM